MTRAVVLDRDGVINDHRRYVNTPADFILFEGVPFAIRTLHDAGFLVLVATNQGGVGLGYLTEEMLYQIHQKMISELEHEGAKIDGIIACPHAPFAGCACRKPKPGMLNTLHAQYGFTKSESYMVGDRETDVQAGQAAGLRTVFIGSAETKADISVSSLMDAANWIVKQSG
ncbi:HAD-IIIA family hydrolase [Alicyclobacillus sp. SO9]|uniref:D-glycero-alpha-D-manno-heptose-1,7-bisphosphate 7-phosphatase n=1 Tax=Alicyclobacillus sp. SO9 TaxID=2665646 RepID=UPI0018E78069|nr:HAD family hydrolase [Alicyclobacillus sp. SO9]QQE77053.1 HAD family hydrolase [Alicyclobacillus sp. SO9]